MAFAQAGNDEKWLFAQACKKISRRPILKWPYPRNIEPAIGLRFLDNSCHLKYIFLVYESSMNIANRSLK